MNKQLIAKVILALRSSFLAIQRLKSSWTENKVAWVSGDHGWVTTRVKRFLVSLLTLNFLLFWFQFDSSNSSICPGTRWVADRILVSFTGTITKEKTCRYEMNGSKMRATLSTNQSWQQNWLQCWFFLAKIVWVSDFTAFSCKLRAMAMVLNGSYQRSIDQPSYSSVFQLPRTFLIHWEGKHPSPILLRYVNLLIKLGFPIPLSFSYSFQ